MLKQLFPFEWHSFLNTNVIYYKKLSGAEKFSFQREILIFLSEVQINGIKTVVTDHDRLLVATSAIIPIFKFPDWEFKIIEVLLYPYNFNQDFRTGKSETVLGMVGDGAMNRIMILSKQALYLGFKNAFDKKNVGIHEFIHLIDKADGSIDGIPEILLQNQYVIPCLDFIDNEIEKIRKGKSSIPIYGATNKAEFFAVASEYLFENLNLLKAKHSELYNMLENIFRQNMVDVLDSLINTGKINRNDKCFCGSGLKYKNCCGKRR